MNFFRQNSEAINPPPDPVPAHPYSPQHLTIAGYVPNNKSTMELLVSFAAAWIPIFAAVWMMASVYGRSLRTADKMIMMWFTLCGCLHVFFEGYLVINHQEVGARQGLFAQLWKEYSLSDSRYLTSDTFVLSAETLSVVLLGSLSWSMVFLIYRSSPYRHAVQVMICAGHIYSDLLYFATAGVDLYTKDIDYCRPEPYYFWVYYFGMNIIWILVPSLLLVQSATTIATALATLDRMAKTVRANGRVVKAS